MDASPPPEGPEVMQIHPEPPPRRSRTVIVLVCCLAVAGAVVFWRLTASPTPNSAPDVPTPTAVHSHPKQHASPTPIDAPTARGTVAHTDLKWLGASTAYTVFIRTYDAVYRVQPHHEVVVRTAVPTLQSSGPVFFVPVAGEVLVTPLDSVPAYVVPDDGPAHRLDLNAHGGRVLPGPDPQHVWVRDDASQVLLVGLDGTKTGIRIRLPSVMEDNLMPDGQGYLLVQSQGGLYDARPSGITRVANGRVLAVGPSRLVVSTCDVHATCRAELLGRDFAALRSLPNVRSMPQLSGGVISPDGHTAAFATSTSSDTPQVKLIDLTDGTARPTTTHLTAGSAFADAMAFSPDSRWLFAVDGSGEVRAVDVRTGRTRVMQIDLTDAEQVAVRPAS